jgi:hypothetical protein
MSYGVTMTRTQPRTFGDPPIIALDIDITDGVIPSWEILEAIKSLSWFETLVINNIIEIEMRGHKDQPDLYGHIVGQLALSDICFGPAAGPNAAALARMFIQGSLTTMFAGKRRLDKMSLRDAKKLGLDENREGDDDYLVYTPLGRDSIARNKS